MKGRFFNLPERDKMKISKKQSLQIAKKIKELAKTEQEFNGLTWIAVMYVTDRNGPDMRKVSEESLKQFDKDDMKFAYRIALDLHERTLKLLDFLDTNVLKVN